MRVILGDLDVVGCFVDDACLFTDTWEEHMGLLEKVFERMQVAGYSTKFMHKFADVA